MPWQGVAAHTRVFWDVADFPIPSDRYRQFPEFPKNIKKCLEIAGYRGDVSIQAYDNGELPFSVFCHFRLAGIMIEQHDLGNSSLEAHRFRLFLGAMSDRNYGVRMYWHINSTGFPPELVDRIFERITSALKKFDDKFSESSDCIWQLRLVWWYGKV